MDSSAEPKQNLWHFSVSRTTTVPVVYTDKGVFLEILGVILYSNTFVVNSLLSDVYLIEVQYSANCGMFVT